MIGRDDTTEKKAANRILHECSRDREDLVREFFEWRARAPWEMALDDAVEMWASKRWTTPVPPAALGIIHAAAKLYERFGPDEEENAIVPPRNRGEGVLDYVHRIASINGWLKDGAKLPKSMPEARLPYKDAREPGEEG